jgi:xanthine/uracil/vitamin C permease (AzgA family)
MYGGFPSFFPLFSAFELEILCKPIPLASSVVHPSLAAKAATPLLLQFCTSVCCRWLSARTYGIGLGFISYIVIKVVQGKIKEIKPLMWVAALAFLLMFIFV